MRKQAIAIALVLTAVFFIGQNAMAYDAAGKIGLGLELGYNNISDEDIPDATVGKWEYDASVMFGLNATYWATDWFSAEFGVDYTKCDIEETDTMYPGSSIDVGELAQIPILLTARFHYPNSSIVSPYIAGGFGYYVNSIDESGLLSAAGLSLDADNSFGFHLGGGLEIFASDNVAIDIDARYTWNSTDVEADFKGVSLGDTEMDVDAFTAMVGFKYYF